MLSPVTEHMLRAMLNTGENFSGSCGSQYDAGYRDGKVDLIVNSLHLDSLSADVCTYSVFELVGAAVDGDLTCDDLIRQLNGG